MGELPTYVGFGAAPEVADVTARTRWWCCPAHA